MYNYPLRYRTYNQVLDEVSIDFKKYTLENMIEPHELIKVAKKINYDLGLRIMMTKERLLEVENGKVKLPDDFYVLNYALICDKVGYYQQMPQGTHLEDVKIFPKYQETTPITDPCIPPVVNCNTIGGCTCSTPGSCNGNCGCGCNNCHNPSYNVLCEPPITDTTQINNTGTVTYTHVAIKPISQCTWTISDKVVSNTMTVTINSVVYNFAWADTLTYLNGLSLGIFSLISGTDNILSVYGTNTYGDLTTIFVGSPLIISPVCVEIGQETDTTTTTTVTNTNNTDNFTTQNCCAINPDPCAKPRVFMNCKNECWEVVQIVNPGTVNYFKRLLPIKILENAEMIDCGCPNLYMNAENTGWIKDGYLYTNFHCGKVYINFQGTLVDDDNNILVPDHDGLNEYYEYALKERILENLAMNDEPVGQKLQLIQAKLHVARLYALTIVNTPNFAEMKRLWWTNRKAQYQKYYNMFKSYEWYQWDRNPNLDMIQNPYR